jgi:hypothetical protein
MLERRGALINAHLFDHVLRRLGMHQALLCRITRFAYGKTKNRDSVRPNRNTISVYLNLKAIVCMHATLFERAKDDDTGQRKALEYRTARSA